MKYCYGKTCLPDCSAPCTFRFVYIFIFSNCNKVLFMGIMASSISKTLPTLQDTKINCFQQHPISTIYHSRYLVQLSIHMFKAHCDVPCQNVSTFSSMTNRNVTSYIVNQMQRVLHHFQTLKQQRIIMTIGIYHQPEFAMPESWLNATMSISLDY